MRPQVSPGYFPVAPRPNGPVSNPFFRLPAISQNDISWEPFRIFTVKYFSSGLVRTSPFDVYRHSPPSWLDRKTTPRWTTPAYTLQVKLVTSQSCWLLRLRTDPTPFESVLISLHSWFHNSPCAPPVSPTCPRNSRGGAILVSPLLVCVISDMEALQGSVIAGLMVISSGGLQGLLRTGTVAMSNAAPYYPSVGDRGW